MKKIIILCVAICFLNCSESDSYLENNLLTGSFKEISPVVNRVTVTLTSQSLSYLKEGFSSSLSFTVKILSSTKLELSCNECDETAPTIVSYKTLDTNTFEIGGFIQEAENQLMTFKRI